MKKNICRMKTHDSLWPSNIDTADVLVIDEPCKVTDAYYLFTDRPKIKTIKIAGHSYSRQELSNMEPHLHLGGGFIEERPLVNPAPIPVPPVAGGPITWDQPEIWMTEEETPGIVGQLQQAQTVIPNADLLQEMFRANQDMPRWVRAIEEVPDVIGTPGPQITIETMQQALAQEHRRPTLNEMNNLAAIQYHPTRRITYYTDPVYEQAIEALRMNNPAYRQFGDIAIADGYTQA